MTRDSGSMWRDICRVATLFTSRGLTSIYIIHKSQFLPARKHTHTAHYENQSVDVCCEADSCICEYQRYTDYSL
jgi:hypothetical protein